jgi:hypothetical protein
MFFVVMAHQMMCQLMRKCSEPIGIAFTSAAWLVVVQRMEESNIKVQCPIRVKCNGPTRRIMIDGNTGQIQLIHSAKMLQDIGKAVDGMKILN